MFKNTSMEQLISSGAFISKTDVITTLQKDPTVYMQFLKMNSELQDDLISFCLGERGLNVTYDAVFKKIFDPQVHPERLEEFLSLCLGESVTILKTMPNESSRLTEESSLLVMDILVKLSSGSLVNVEIQRIGYLFPGARCACYSSDLLMRQYSQVKAEKARENKKFSYKDIKKVYTIILIQESTREFKGFPNDFLHYAKQHFNTELELDLLQEYLIIPLDIFKEYWYNNGIKNRLEAWLAFIISSSLEDIEKVISSYPDFKELYQEIFDFRFHVKELVGMYSKILSEYDANTVKLMIEEYMEEAQAMREQNVQMREQNAQLQEELLRLKAIIDASGIPLSE